MRRWNLRCWALALWVLAAALPTAAAAIPMLSVHLSSGGTGGSSSLTVNSGASFTVEVRAQDIPATGLFGFGYRVQFDATAFNSSAAIIDGLWTGLSAIDNTPGNSGATANRNGQASGPSGFDIVLASATFTALRPGTFQLQLVPFTAQGDNLLFDGTPLDDGSNRGFFGNGSVTVLRAVPEAAAAALLGLGVAGLAGRRRRSGSN